MRKLSEKLYSAYPFINNTVPNEPIVDRFTREIAIEWACKSGNELCLYDTYAQVHLVSHHGRSVPKGLEEVIFCNGLKGNRQGEWVDMWEMMQASNNVEERGIILRSLSCADDLQVLRDFLQSSIATNSDNNYSRSERLQIFQSILANSAVGIKAVIDFFEKHEKDGIALM